MISADLGHISNYPHRGPATHRQEGAWERPSCLRVRSWWRLRQLSLGNTAGR
jgi:hypothetical protein